MGKAELFVAVKRWSGGDVRYSELAVLPGYSALFLSSPEPETEKDPEIVVGMRAIRTWCRLAETAADAGMTLGLRSRAFWEAAERVLQAGTDHRAWDRCGPTGIVRDLWLALFLASRLKLRPEHCILIGRAVDAWFRNPRKCGLLTAARKIVDDRWCDSSVWKLGSREILEWAEDVLGLRNGEPTPDVVAARGEER